MKVHSRRSWFAIRLAQVLTALTIAVMASASVGQTPGVSSFPGSSNAGHSPDQHVRRPIDAHDSVFLEEMTWLEVRDAIRGGKTTALLGVGGFEQSGPYLIVGKHAVVLRAVSRAVARQLGDALVAPFVMFVPEGAYDPPTGFMRYPGTISVERETFRRLLADVASSLAAQGFRHVMVLSDHGGLAKVIEPIVADLASRWSGRTSFNFVPEFYNYQEVADWLERRGIHQIDEGLHDDVGITATMMTIDPESVRMKERLARKLFTINGISLEPPEHAIALGHEIVKLRAAATANAIRKIIRTERK